MSGAVHPQRARGAALRRALMQVARLCLERRCLLPRHVDIARLVGVDPSQIGQHWARLEREGRVTRSRHGTRHGVRFRVRSVMQ